MIYLQRPCAIDRLQPGRPANTLSRCVQGSITHAIFSPLTTGHSRSNVVDNQILSVLNIRFSAQEQTGKYFGHLRRHGFLLNSWDSVLHNKKLYVTPYFACTRLTQNVSISVRS